MQHLSSAPHHPQTTHRHTHLTTHSIKNGMCTDKCTHKCTTRRAVWRAAGRTHTHTQGAAPHHTTHHARAPNNVHAAISRQQREMVLVVESVCARPRWQGLPSHYIYARNVMRALACTTRTHTTRMMLAEAAFGYDARRRRRRRRTLALYAARQIVDMCGGARPKLCCALHIVCP